MAFQDPIYLFVSAALASLAAQPVAASSQTAALCELAAEDAAVRTGIPAQIMQVLSLTETGREIDGTLRPWPWALNHAGTGHWFASQGQMLVFAENLLAAGDTNFDLGCFQLNYRWHQQSFESLQEMTDPVQNANYAAGFLRSKHQETGSWEGAIGAYHSETKQLASKYLSRFISILAGLHTTPGQNATQREPVEDPVQQTSNSYPLLISGQTHPGPSLFPQVSARNSLFGVYE